MLVELLDRFGPLPLGEAERRLQSRVCIATADGSDPRRIDGLVRREAVLQQMREDLEAADFNLGAALARDEGDAPAAQPTDEVASPIVLALGLLAHDAVGGDVAFVQRRSDHMQRTHGADGGGLPRGAEDFSVHAVEHLELFARRAIAHADVAGLVERVH